jgi:hypothetical protein
LRVYGLGRNLEQEFLIAPGASPDAIQMGFSGARGLRIARDGSLVVDTEAALYANCRRLRISTSTASGSRSPHTSSSTAKIGSASRSHRTSTDARW